MKTELLITFDLDEEIEVEILLPVTFTATKGYPATHWDPGYPDAIEDVQFDEKEAIRIVFKNLEENGFDVVVIDSDAILEQIDDFLCNTEVEAKLLDVANQEARDYEDEKAEYRYEEMKDAEIMRGLKWKD